jgi:hypothetical protein
MRNQRGGRGIRLLVPVGVAVLLALVVVFGAVLFERGGALAVVMLGVAAGAIAGYWAVSGQAADEPPDEPEDRW